MNAEELARLRTAFDDPRRWVKDVPMARAAVLLHEHLLERIDEAVTASGARAVIVKGAALARCVYAEAWMRPMTDVDVIVRPSELPSICGRLQAAGFSLQAVPTDRRWSAGVFNEVALHFPVGPTEFLVELHVSLDKVVKRPVDHDAIFDRATPWGRSLLFPSAEDHLLLVVLHAANTDFEHPLAWLDLHVLLGEELDLDAVLDRARVWRLTTALYGALQTLDELGSDRVPNALLSRCRPSKLRERWMRRVYRLEHANRYERDGLPWMLRQWVLRDDPARWAMGCASYAGLRAAERLVTR